MLSTISSRLFCELLRNRTGVTREHLLNVVWADHGLTASNNNLNNHISILRKHLEELADLHDLIKTVPKKGFALNRSHKVVAIESHEEPPDEALPPPPVSKNRSVRSYHIALALFMLVFVASFSVMYGKRIYYTFTQSQPKTFYKHQGCVLKTLREIPEKKREASIAIVMGLLSQNDVDCQNDRYDVFFYLSGEEQGKVPFKMLSVCRNGEDGNYYQCLSIKVV